MKKLPLIILLTMITITGVGAFMIVPLEDDADIRALDEGLHERKTEAAFEGSNLYDNIDCGDCCSVCHPLTYTATLRWRRIFN